MYLCVFVWGMLGNEMYAQHANSLNMWYRLWWRHLFQMCSTHFVAWFWATKNGSKHTFCLLHHLFFWHVVLQLVTEHPQAIVGDQTFAVGITDCQTLQCVGYSQGSSNYPFLGESNNTNLWQFWWISLITLHRLGWQYNDPWLPSGKLT